ncbi:RM10 protein, partial [Mohoua ochrocephala]|nr:RM10 protein [Mohoua ochrocephala]
GPVPVPVPVLSAAPAAWLPALQLLRRGSKAVTRHWKAMHFQRQKLLALTEYLPPRPAVPPRCLPRRTAEGHEVRHGPVRGSAGTGGCPPPGSDTGVGQSLGETFPGCVIHGLGCGGGWEMPGQVLETGERSLPEGLWVFHVHPELPFFFPGACIDDTILSRQGVENFARLPPLEVSQGQTVAALALPSSQTSSLLQRGPARLTALLDEHIRRLREAGGPTEPPPGQSTGNC